MNYCHLCIVQEAMYSCCHENAPCVMWNEKKHPFTLQKQQKIVDNLAPVSQYMKDEFVFEHRGIDDLFADFYMNFKEWCHIEHKRADSKSLISKTLKDHSITVRSGTANKTYVWQSAEDLAKFYITENWIVQTDDFEDTLAIQVQVKEGIPKKPVSDKKAKSEVVLSEILKKCQILVNEFRANEAEYQKEFLKREEFLAQLTKQDKCTPPKQDKCTLPIEVSNQEKNPIHKIAQTPMTCEIGRVEEIDIMDLFQIRLILHHQHRLICFNNFIWFPCRFLPSNPLYQYRLDTTFLLHLNEKTLFRCLRQESLSIRIFFVSLHQL